MLFFELADLQKAEAVRRMDELFAVKREINGRPLDQRLAVRRDRSKLLVGDLERWLRQERRKLSSKNPVTSHRLYLETMPRLHTVPG